MKAATLVALALLAALCTASQYQNRRVNDNDSQEEQPAKLFRAGYEYTYFYNGQISSGLEVSGPNSPAVSSEEPQQKATIRIQAEAKIAFESERRASLNLARISIGQLNEQIESPHQVQPMSMFDRKEVEDSMLRKLQLPCQFQYKQGVVEQVQFHSEDSAWSKNIKRAVLNLIQVNLQKQQSNQQTQQWESDEQQQDEQQESQSQKSFSLPETTIEGECWTTYTVNNQQTNDQQPQERRSAQNFNVTKTIDFKNCKKIADVAFGYQNQQQQPQCQKCMKAQQQQQPQQQQQQSQGCPEECDPKEIKNQQLDRSTAIRFVLAKKGSQQDAGIKRAELLSQYVYKNARSESTTMRTVVAAELVFRSVQPKQQKQQSFQPESNSQKDTLLYDNEWDEEEKRFYMNGDEEFNRGKSPFSNVANKEEQIVKIIRKVAEDATDKLNGIESRTASKMQRAVELLRMCRLSELKQIQQHLTGQSTTNVQKKAQQIFADSLALAGTQNTIQVLTEQIREQALQSQEAVQALRQLTSLPAPSDKQVETVLRLCKEQVNQRDNALKQACWLTVGSMVGELCQQKTQAGQKTLHVFGAQSGFTSSHQCSPAKKENFKQALLEQYEQAKNTYEKILALKALGNAGIDTTVQPLERIINDPQESRIVRAQAIDALRRLRAKMPRKIQRILLPIMQNTREHPAVRISAFTMILYTAPDASILDQMAYTLNKDRNPQMQAFAYTVLKLLSKSKIPSNQKIANHLKNTLQLTNAYDQTVRVYHAPIFNEEHREGVFLSLASAYSHRNNILPSHLVAVLDTMINDELEVNALRVAFTQQGLEQWYEGLVQSLLKGKSRSQQTRGQRSSANPQQSNEDELRQIFSGLKIKSRKSVNQYQSDDEEENNQQNEQGQQRQNKQPFAMITTRFGDVDTVILPIDARSMPKCLKALTQGQQISLAECLSAMQRPVHFNKVTVMKLIEKTAKIPTSMGLPLRVLQAMPVLSSVEGQIRDNSEGMAIKVQAKVHAVATAVHIQKMEIWTPMVTTGVEVNRAAELNIPVESEIQINDQGSFKLSVKPPKSQTRLFGVHTLPHTYALDFDSRSHLLKESQVKTIQMPQFERFQQDIDEVIGNQQTGELFRIEGHVHRPQNPTDLKQLLQHSMCTENHIHIKYEPKNGPEEIVLRGQLSAFAKISGMGPSMKMYKETNEFDLMDDQDFEQQESHDQRRSSLNSFQREFNSPMYKHQLNVVLETKGGRTEQKAEIDASAICDSKLQFCRLQLDAKRTPVLSSESQDWTLRSDMQIIMPDAVSNVQNLQQSKFQKAAIEGNVEWGNSQKQSIKFRLHGENSRSQEWRQQIQQLEKPQQKYYEKQTAFINKFDLVAEYTLNHQTQMKFYELLEYVKTYTGFWNTNTQPQRGQEGEVKGSVVIDPITMQHVSVIVKTPSQVVRCENLQLPGMVRPFALVRPDQKQIHSVSHLVSRFAVGNERAECSVDGKRVETFDDVIYRAPIGKCYSVLAKDCSNENQPQFAVLMKTVNNGKDKKIKVITPEQLIECQPEETSTKKLTCSVNGQTVDADESNQQQESDGSQAVQYNNDEQTDVTVSVEGVQVRFGCWGSNGCKNQKAWIKLSSQYKEGQCGLCGHYDEQADDEWRMPNGQHAQDMQQFHRSYSLRDGQDAECTNQEQDDFYSRQNKHKFQQVEEESQEDGNQGDSFADPQRSSKYAEKYDDDDWNQNDDDDEWHAGAYHSSEERIRSYLKKKNQQMRGNRQNQQEDFQEPTKKTKVMEYGHQVCFSHQPVKQCPQGTQPDQQKSLNVKFVCLSRSKPETRRMQQQARRGQIVDTSNYQPATVQVIPEPARCTVY